MNILNNRAGTPAVLPPQIMQGISQIKQMQSLFNGTPQQMLQQMAQSNPIFNEVIQCTPLGYDCKEKRKRCQPQRKLHSNHGYGQQLLSSYGYSHIYSSRSRYYCSRSSAKRSSRNRSDRKYYDYNRHYRSPQSFVYGDSKDFQLRYD